MDRKRADDDDICRVFIEKRLYINYLLFSLFQFRVALLLSHHHGEPIVSHPSVVISTLASGTPASPPAIVRAVPVDWSRISVSWEPGPFPHGPILSYVLNISEIHPQGYSALKVHTFMILWKLSTFYLLYLHLILLCIFSFCTFLLCKLHIVVVW